MSEPTTRQPAKDAKDFWVTLGVFFIATWILLAFLLGWWGIALGWIIALPAAFAFTIFFWIAVDVFKRYVLER